MTTQLKPFIASRRRFMLAAAAAAPTAAASADEAFKPFAGVPLALPKRDLVYEAKVDIAASMRLGEGPLGERRMVPITGGEFEGPKLKGKVLPGGADRQLVRKDGARQLDAL